MLGGACLLIVVGCQPAQQQPEHDGDATYDMDALLAAKPTTVEGMRTEVQHLFKAALDIREFPTEDHKEADRRQADADQLFARAEYWSKQAIALDPKRYDGYQALGDALAHQGKYDEAMKAYQEAVRRDPKSAESQHAMGMVALQQARAAKGDARKKKLAEARRHWQDRLKIEPKSADAHYYAGVGAHHEGDWQPAKKHYQSALKINADHSNAKSNLGLILAKQDGDLAGAIKLWNEIVAKDPHHIRAQGNLARAASKKKQYDEAAQHWLAAAQAEHRTPKERKLKAEVWYRLAVLYEHRLDDHEKATEAAEKAVKLQPQNLQYRQFLRRIQRKALRRR